MKKGVHRKGEFCTGHGCWPPRANVEGSQNVFCNSIEVHREGDYWGLHVCKDAHIGNLKEGSKTVKVNNQGMARITDPVNCGSFASTGSGNVFCGD